MIITLSNIKPQVGEKKTKKRVGRGNASGHGTYSTRGLKGQKSRSGGKSGLKALGLKMVVRGVPKSKGFTSLKVNYTAINLARLNKIYKAGDIITPSDLKNRGIINKKESKKIKIVGNQVLTKVLTVNAHGFSESASSSIIKAGGKAVII